MADHQKITVTVEWDGRPETVAMVRSFISWNLVENAAITEWAKDVGVSDWEVDIRPAPIRVESARIGALFESWRTPPIGGQTDG
jgi:hypothetical protein